MWIIDNRVPTLTLPLTPEQQAAKQQAALVTLESWRSRVRELRALLAKAIEVQRKHQAVVGPLVEERRAIERAPRTDIRMDPFGTLIPSLPDPLVNRHAVLVAEIARLEAQYEASLEEPRDQREGWDKWGKSRPWSVKRVGDIEVELRDALVVVLRCEQEAGVAPPLT